MLACLAVRLLLICDGVAALWERVYGPVRLESDGGAIHMGPDGDVSAMGPVLMSQAFAPQLSRGAVIANLSARVGSISDNRLGNGLTPFERR